MRIFCQFFSGVMLLPTLLLAPVRCSGGEECGGDGSKSFNVWLRDVRAGLPAPEKLGVFETKTLGGFTKGVELFGSIRGYYDSKGHYEVKGSKYRKEKRSGVVADYDERFSVIRESVSGRFLMLANEAPWTEENIRMAVRTSDPRIPFAPILYCSTGWRCCTLGSLCPDLKSPEPRAGFTFDPAEGAWVGARFNDAITGKSYEVQRRFSFDVEPAEVVERSKKIQLMCLLDVLEEFRATFSDASVHVYPE